MQKIEKILSGLERVILLAIIFMFPLASLLPVSPNPFVVGKLALLVFGITTLLILKIIRIFTTGKFELALGNFDAVLFLVGLATLLSTIFKTANKMEALLLPGTTTAIIGGILFYFLLNQVKEKHELVVKLTLIVTGIVVALITITGFTGILTGVTFLPQYLKNPQLTLEGGYLPLVTFFSILLPLTIEMLISLKNTIMKMLLGISLGLILCGLGLSIYQILPGKPTTPRFPSFFNSWVIAIDTIKISPLWGIGPGNYLTAYNRFRPQSINQTDLWQVKFTTGNSFYITFITETGILGLTALIFWALAYIHYSKSRLQKFQRADITKYLPLFSLTLLIVFLGFFPANTLLLLLLFILFSVVSNVKIVALPLKAYSQDTSVTSRFPAILLLLPFLMGIVFVFWQAIRIFAAEFTFQRGMVAVSANQAIKSYDFIRQAISFNPQVDRYRLSFSQINLALAQSLVRKSEVSDQDRTYITQLIQQAIAEGKAGVALNPYRAGNWANLTSIYQSIRPLARGTDAFATQTARQAIALDPYNPQLHLNLGGIYFTLKDFDRAIRSFALAVNVKPDLPNAHYNLAFALAENGRLEEAISEMNLVLTLLPFSSPDRQLAQKALTDFQGKKAPPVSTGTELIPPPEAEKPLLKPPLDLPQEVTPPAAPEIPEASPDVSSQPSVSP